jgi:hypothetical protein
MNTTQGITNPAASLEIAKKMRAAVLQFTQGDQDAAIETHAELTREAAQSGRLPLAALREAEEKYLTEEQMPELLLFIADKVQENSGNVPVPPSERELAVAELRSIAVMAGAMGDEHFDMTLVQQTIDIEREARAAGWLTRAELQEIRGETMRTYPKAGAAALVAHSTALVDRIEANAAAGTAPDAEPNLNALTVRQKAALFFRMLATQVRKGARPGLLSVLEAGAEQLAVRDGFFTAEEAEAVMTPPADLDLNDDGEFFADALEKLAQLCERPSADVGVKAA